MYMDLELTFLFSHQMFQGSQPHLCTWIVINSDISNDKITFVDEESFSIFLCTSSTSKIKY